MNYLYQMVFKVKKNMYFIVLIEREIKSIKICKNKMFFLLKKYGRETQINVRQNVCVVLRNV